MSANYLQPKQLPGATALTAASYEATHYSHRIQRLILVLQQMENSIGVCMFGGIAAGAKSHTDAV